MLVINCQCPILVHKWLSNRSSYVFVLTNPNWSHKRHHIPFIFFPFTFTESQLFPDKHLATDTTNTVLQEEAWSRTRLRVGGHLSWPGGKGWVDHMSMTEGNKLNKYCKSSPAMVHRTWLSAFSLMCFRMASGISCRYCGDRGKGRIYALCSDMERCKCQMKPLSMTCGVIHAPLQWSSVHGCLPALNYKSAAVSLSSSTSFKLTQRFECFGRIHVETVHILWRKCKLDDIF